MAGVELATAYLTLVPSLKGASKSIASQLGAVDVSKAGAKMGKSLSDSIGKAMSTDGLEKFNVAVRAAEKNLRDAMSGSEVAAQRVEAAELALAEAVEKHGESSSQAAAAQARLSSANRSAAQAAAKQEDATTKLERAQMELAQATSSANAAAKMQSSMLGRLSSMASSASSSLGKMSSKLSDASSRIQGVGMSMTAGITAPMAAGVAAMGNFALSTASAAETTEISFTTMLGSAEAAESMMADLSDFATKTPFELSGLQSATRQLLAYGFTADEIIPMLTKVGDATAALGTGQYGIEAVTRALGQMQTRGKVSAEDMLQLTEQGIPAWEYLARAIGTDTAGAMEAVTDGAITASEGIAAITKGMEEDFGGMMESQSKTVQGLMSNLSDAIERPLMALRDTDAYEHFAEALAKVVDSAGPFVESLLPHMEKGIDGVAGILGKASDAMDSFASMSEEGQANIIGIATAAGAAGPALTVLGTAGRAVGGIIGGASKVLEKGSSILGRFASSSASAAEHASATATATASMASGADKATAASGKLNGALKVLKVGLSGLGIGIVVTAIGSLIVEMQKASENAALMESATRGIGDISDEAAESIANMARGSLEAAQSMSDLGDSAADALSEIGSNSSMLDGYVDTIERLADKSGLTASEQWELKNAVEGYNEVTGDTVAIIDAVNGKLDTSTQEIMENAEAWKENAKAQALHELAVDYLKEQYSLQQDLAKAQEHLNDVAKDGEGTWLLDGAISDEQGRAFQEAQSEVERLSDLLATATTNADALSTQSMIMASSLDTAVKEALVNLPMEMQPIGFNIASQLASGISLGTVSVQGATQFLTFAVGTVLSGLSGDALAKGTEMVNSLASAISNGSITAEQATMILTAAVSGEVDDLPPELRSYGEQASSALGTGIGSNEDYVRQESDKLAEASAAVGEYKDDAKTWGSHLGNNFASGIGSAFGAVAAAAAQLASAAASSLEHTTPKVGPLKNDDVWGYHMGINFAEGMERSIPLIERASDTMAEAATLSTAYEYGKYSAARVASSALEPFGISFGGIAQTINFNQPVQSAYQVAQAMKRYSTYGLAGAR